MKKKIGGMGILMFVLLSLTGCGPIGAKSASLSTIYGITTALSLLLLALCFIIIRRRDKWFTLLFSCVFVVNTGYLALSLSQNLESALMANRLSYLGSVFLPMSMLMIILNACRLSYRRWLPGLLLGLSIIIFLIAASPGILDIYYKEVSLTVINGVGVLEKVYGPLHPLYLFYLLFYFGAMAGTIAYASSKKKIASSLHAVSLAAAVFVNIGVWLLEQLVRIDFELLSVSYIICEFFLLSLYLMQQENRRLNPTPETALEEAQVLAEVPCEDAQAGDGRESEGMSFADNCAYFSAQLPRLTPTEQTVFRAYLAGKSPDEIMQELNIKKNTLKYHNRNIYSKLGVCSRKQLLEIAAALKLNDAEDEASAD